ncbi:hypothetical protein CAEBREN_25501 [Caenorhabditis brenneri]|uniref:Uncharacterized protein n=1 Tax=Caenorhabditis brenneri TaxID=135651 RepID=G0PK25_CAEBE|nr:hypothetical protein CAEBREN_25501 [Caenorhabditis brenneri]
MANLYKIYETFVSEENVEKMSNESMRMYSNLRIAENDTDFYLVIYNDNRNPEVKYNVQVHYNMLNNSNGIMHRFWRKIRNYEDTEKMVLSHDKTYFDAKNGICRIENFAEHLAADTFPEIELGRLCGMEW